MSSIAPIDVDSDGSLSDPPTHSSPPLLMDGSPLTSYTPATQQSSGQGHTAHHKKTSKKRKRTGNDDEERPLPRWSYRKPTTHAKVQEELYGKKVKLLKKTKKHFRPGSIIRILPNLTL